MAVGEAKAVLVTLPPSHFCEMARWALERYAVPFSKEGHAPGFHMSALRKHGSTKGSTPCLIVSEGDVGPTLAQESLEILRWVDQRALALRDAAKGDPPPLLFPPELDPEVSRLCALFNARLGPAVRQWSYAHTLHLPGARAKTTPPSVPALERMALAWGGWMVVRRVMAQNMNISAETGKAALVEVRSVLQQISSVLSDGRKYLTGDTLTAADISFASLAAPAVGQAFAVHKGLSESTPREMREEIEEMRGTLAGKFVLRVWQEERARVVV